MLKLTDDELTRIFQAAAPIAIERRDDFLEAVAAILLGSAGPIGSGTVHYKSSGANQAHPTSIRLSGRGPPPFAPKGSLAQPPQ